MTAAHEVELVELSSCDSTQQAASSMLEARPPGSLLAVATRSQQAGRGRGGRRWQDPPGPALLLTVARNGPRPVEVLEELPRLVVQELLAALEELVPSCAVELQWRAPNDIVAAATGEKVGGILVDARTTADAVDRLLVGIGLNLGGPPFRTADGRAATSVAAACGTEPCRSDLLDAVARRVGALL